MSQPHVDSTPKRSRYITSPRNVFSPGKIQVLLGISTCKIRVSSKILFWEIKLGKYMTTFSLTFYIITAVPGSGRSSRASTGGGSRPPSRADSECSEISEPEMYTTVQRETKNTGGRNQTVLTYQTHVVKTRTAGAPSPSVRGTPSSKGSRIPKPSSAHKKWWIHVMWFT